MLFNDKICKLTITLLALLFILASCAEKPIEIGLGKTFSRYGSEFSVIDAQRYSYGDAGNPKEYLMILLEWKCQGSPTKECQVGGADFLLKDTYRNQSYETVSVLLGMALKQHFFIPQDAFPCCGLGRDGETYKVYLTFPFVCYGEMVLRYPANVGDSKNKVKYLVKLPDSAQCNNK